MRVEYINPFIKASKEILTQMTHIDFQVGKPALKSSPFTANNIVILIGITGDIKGQAILSFDKTMALNIVSKMMGGMEIKELDDISKSALSELGNMILGNSATLLFNIGVQIDITPPTLMTGENLSFSTNQMQIINVPLMANDSRIDLNVSVKE